jgi:DNA-binding beta-propeller fold protein YncE
LLAAALVTSIAVADALLVVRKSEHAVDFVEPGTGARLMSVDVGFTPHEIGVSPDGRRAIVTNYGTTEQPGTRSACSTSSNRTRSPASTWVATRGHTASRGMHPTASRSRPKGHGTC